MIHSDDQAPDKRDVRDWARQMLGLAGDSDEQWRSHVLQRLTAGDFVPPDAWYDAIDVYAAQFPATATAIPDGYYRDREYELREEVDQFLAQFFELPPPIRRQTWMRLSRLCAPWLPLQLRLNPLELGLDVVTDLPPETSTSIVKLRDLVCTQFLRPRGNAFREAWTELSQLRWRPEMCEGVAKALRHDHAHIYRLMPELIDEFADATVRQRWKNLRQIWPDWSGDWVPKGGNSPVTTKNLLFLALSIGGPLFLAAGLGLGFMLMSERAELKRRLSISTPKINSANYPDPKVKVPQFPIPKQTEPTAKNSSSSRTTQDLNAYLGRLKAEIDRLRQLGERATPAQKEQLTSMETTRILIETGVLKLKPQPDLQPSEQPPAATNSNPPVAAPLTPGPGS